MFNLLKNLKMIRMIISKKRAKGGEFMKKNCSCPTNFNIFIGCFLLLLSILATFHLFKIFLPNWLNTITAICGILTILLNLLNYNSLEAKNLNLEQANKMHANEGY